MTISKTFKFEFTIELDDENQDLMDRLTKMYEKGTLVDLKKMSDKGRTGISLHQIVAIRAGIHIPTGFHIDHDDQNRYNNTAKNLIPKSPRDNYLNRTNSIEKQSRYYGVSWATKREKWYAIVRSGNFYKGNGKAYNCGYYDTEEDAAKAVDDKSVELGLDKPLNFPERYPTYGLAQAGD